MIILIGAKGKSTRIANKNRQDLNGVPLIGWTLSKVRRWFGRSSAIYVATEDVGIIDIARRMGASIWPLSREYVEDKKHHSELIQEVCLKISTRPLLHMQVTSPFTFKDDVVPMLESDVDFCRTIQVKKLHTFYSGITLNQNLGLIMANKGNAMVIRRQGVPSLEEMTSPEWGLPICDLSAIEIDEPEDLELARFVAQGFTIHSFDKAPHSPKELIRCAR